MVKGKNARTAVAKHDTFPHVTHPLPNHAGQSDRFLALVAQGEVVGILPIPRQQPPRGRRVISVRDTSCDDATSNNFSEIPTCICRIAGTAEPGSSTPEGARRSPMVGSANSLDHILSEDEQTQAANGRQIYSLFDDEQDWAGLLNGLEPVSQGTPLAMPHPNAPL